MNSPYGSAIILRGERSHKEKFINDFIKKNKISSFNLFEYKDPLKILEVRQIKKILKFTSFSRAMRVFIFYSVPTLVAQNALLKTLEELPEDVTFIFAEEINLIPTIESRSRILSFTSQTQAIDSSLTGMLNQYIGDPPAGEAGKKDVFSSLVLSDRLFTHAPDINFGDLILNLRVLLFESIEMGNFRNSRFISRLIKSLNRYISFENNNLNKRLLFERILFDIESGT